MRNKLTIGLIIGCCVVAALGMSFKSSDGIVTIDGTLNITGAISASAQNISASEIDPSTGSVFSKSLGANTTFTFANLADGQRWSVILTNGASWTVTWPTVTWLSGSAPVMDTGAGVVNVFSFMRQNGVTFGDVGQKSNPRLDELGAVASTASLTALATNSFTGTGTVPLSSVTDGKQPLDADLTTLAANVSWTEVTPDGTNSVINLVGALAGVDKNFYYSLSTSNYIIFSNIVAGAQGTIWVNASGTPREVNFLSTYDNFSTNEIAPVFTITNRAVIAFKVGWGTDATNVMLAIKRK